MKILLGTHQLELRAGSELFTAELARAIQSAGHDVAIFTFFKGKFAETVQAAGIPVFLPEETGAIARFAPDLVQTNHLPCAHFLRSAVPDAIRVHAMLGVIPALEAPPLDAESFSLGLAISEEVVDRINRTPFGRAVEVALFRNWFDDKAVVVAGAHQTARPLRVAVISNHIAPDLIDALGRWKLTGCRRRLLWHRATIGRRRWTSPDPIRIDYFDRANGPAVGGMRRAMHHRRHSRVRWPFDGGQSRLRQASNFSGRFARQAITKAHLQHEIEKTAYA